MAWWVDYFRDVDSFEIDRVTRWFHEDIELHFANWPECCGKPAVVASLRDFWKNLKGLAHRNTNSIAQGDWACVEAEITFHLINATSVTVRGATIMRRADGKIVALNVYIDLAPLFASLSPHT